MTDILYGNLVHWIATAGEASHIRELLRPLVDMMSQPIPEPSPYRHLMRRKIRRLVSWP